MAKVYDKVTGSVHEHIVIPAIREQIRMPFVAGPWTDLRFALMLSITAAGADDTTASLAESIPPTGTLPLVVDAERYTIGVIDRETSSTFLGYTNRANGTATVNGTIGKSLLVSSNAGIGTTPANFWRPTNEASDGYTLQITDRGGDTRAISTNGSEIHFPQNPAGAGGYATLLMFRLQRPNAGDQKNLLTLSAKQDVVNRSGDILFTNTPDKTTMLTNLQNFPTSVQTLGPVTVNHEPNMLFLYWPFRSSRLRVHAREFLRAT